MKRILATLVIIYSLVLMTACDKTKSAVDASARIARQVENLVDKNEQSFNDGLYDRTTALRIAEQLKLAIPAARAFNNAVREVRANYGSNKPPRTEFENLTALFYAVERPVRDVLLIYGALSETQNAYLESAIAALKEALQIIRDTFSLAQIEFTEGKRQWA